MNIAYSIGRPMPPELEAQDRELHQKQFDALDRYNFGEALELRKQTALHRISFGSTGEGVSTAS